MINYFAIAFTCVYLILTVGVAKTTHYCMGRLYHSELFSFQSQPCSCSLFKKETDKSCCTDEHELISIDDDQSLGQIASVHAPDYFLIEILGQLDSSLIFNSQDKEVPFFADTSPPPRESLFKLHCSFVFYG